MAKIDPTHYKITVKYVHKMEDSFDVMVCPNACLPFSALSLTLACVFFCKLNSNSTVGSLKSEIFESRGILVDRQVLYVSGKETSESDETAISKCWSLKDGDTIFLKLLTKTETMQNTPSSSKEKANDKDKELGQQEIVKAKDTSVPQEQRMIHALRLATIIESFAAESTGLIRPDFHGVKNDEKTSGWPRISQAYCAYTRKSGTITGVVTVGMSNPFVEQNSNYFAIGERRCLFLFLTL